MVTLDYVHHLAFPKLSESEVEGLAGMAKICSFQDGELIFQAGQRGLPFYVVASGAIAIVDESADVPKTVVVHGPREFTGDVSLLTDRPPSSRPTPIGIYTARTALQATTWDRSAVSAFGRHQEVSYPQALGNKELGTGTASDQQVRPTSMQVGTTAARPVPPRSCGENRCVDTDGPARGDVRGRLPGGELLLLPLA